MNKKIKHHYRFNKNKILKLTPEEHDLAHSLEGVLFTPFAREEVSRIKKEIIKLKKKHRYIKAYRLKKLLKLYLNDAENYFYKIYETGAKLNLYSARQNGKTFLFNICGLNVRYRQLLKKHKYIKAYRLKKIIKNYKEVQK